jgi:hypothetical protein
MPSAVPYGSSSRSTDPSISAISAPTAGAPQRHADDDVRRAPEHGDDRERREHARRHARGEPPRRRRGSPTDQRHRATPSASVDTPTSVVNSPTR